MAQSHHGHEPVLVGPVLRFCAPQPGDVVLDGTVGLGGHAAAMAQCVAPDGVVIGLDVDEEMLAKARDRLAAMTSPPRIELACESYAEFPAVLERLSVPVVDVMLLDLGVNSAQLDDERRGFSFDADGPLDMRFDRNSRTTAADLVNALSESELADVFYEFGQESKSRRVAKRICQARHRGRITTTKVLARVVESAFDDARGRTNPATRVFQALRIAVNRELDNLRVFLERAVEHLSPGGRLAVISFHSLEDGIVKRFVREQKGAGVLREITKRPVIAESDERRRNPRSRSAKLRVAQRVEDA